MNPAMPKPTAQMNAAMAMTVWILVIVFMKTIDETDAIERIDAI